MSFTGATAITAVSAVWKFTRGDTTKFGWTTKLAVTISSASTNSTGSKRSSHIFSPRWMGKKKKYGIVATWHLCKAFNWFLNPPN